MKHYLSKLFIFIVSISIFTACDKDFINVGAEVLDNEHFDMEKYQGALTVEAIQKNTGPIQTNNLAINPLGIYDNPVFGKTIASFVTQVQLASIPTYTTGLTREIKKVTLYIPYFTKNITTNPNGAFDYELDSIVNPQNDYSNKEFKLSIYENNRYLGTPDTSNDLLTQFLSFSNNTDINNFAIASPIGNRLNENALDPINFPASNNDRFVSSNKEIVIPPTTTGGTNTYKAPGLNIRLNDDFFKTKILNPSPADEENLKSNDKFLQYFKGLYFKVEEVPGSEACMNMLDFKKGTITIEYTELKSVASTTDDTVDKTIVINLTGNSASILTNSRAVPTHPEKLYLKGGEGTVAQINLFGNHSGNGKFQEIENLKVDSNGKKRMINEANLVFYIDNSTSGMGYTAGVSAAKAVEPYRLLLYDMRNKRPIIDYFYDSSTSNYLNSSKSIHGGIIDRVVTATNINGRGVKYKIRLTNHIRNIVSNDSTNVTLGLAICKNINNTAFGKQKTPSNPNSNYNYFPTAAVMDPLGTIIWGTSGPTIPAGKEMKLEIWYSKPN